MAENTHFIEPKTPITPLTRQALSRTLPSAVMNELDLAGVFSRTAGSQPDALDTFEEYRAAFLQLQDRILLVEDPSFRGTAGDSILKASAPVKEMLEHMGDRIIESLFSEDIPSARGFRSMIRGSALFATYAISDSGDEDKGKMHMYVVDLEKSLLHEEFEPFELQPSTGCSRTCWPLIYTMHEGVFTALLLVGWEAYGLRPSDVENIFFQGFHSIYAVENDLSVTERGLVPPICMDDI